MDNKIETLETIKEFDGNEYLKKFSFQPDLTKKLDKESKNFDQEMINQIVLWKVNRYAELDSRTLELINNISPKSTEIDIKKTEEILGALLKTKGIRLPMASTILRFRHPNIYQIIDQRVYRVLYEGKGFKIPYQRNAQIEMYLSYLYDLRNACLKHNILFCDADRILYQMDKDLNKNHKIKY